MSRSSHTPPMPTHADLMLAEKLRRELGGEATPREDADTRPENVTQLPAVEVDDPNKKYVPLAAPPKRARVNTEPMANVIVGVTVPPQRAPVGRPPPAPARRAETTSPDRRSTTTPVIPMERRGGMIAVAIVLAAGLAAAAIFVASPPTPPTVATTTMAVVAVPATPPAPPTVAAAPSPAPIPEAPEPLAAAPSPRARSERSERPGNTANGPGTAQQPSARATNTPAVVEAAHDDTKDDIERKIR